MSLGDRTVVPSARRTARAWQAGLRSRPAWLDASFVVTAISIVGTHVATQDLFAVRAALQEALAAPDAAAPLLWDLAAASATVVVLFVAAVVAGKLLLALATQSLGAVRRDRASRVGAARSEVPALVLNVLAVVAVVLCLSQVDALVAASARAVDASPDGLRMLWISWGARTTAAVAALLAALGVAEMLLQRRAHRRSLFQTPAQAREDLRRDAARGRT